MRIGANGLSYPFADRPVPGEALEVAAGVYWIRMPLPISLNHINLWLLDDIDGWIIVDTGMATDDTRRLWEAIFENLLDGKPIKRVICTHMHFDHAGLAGWLCEKWQVDLWMSQAEYLSCRLVAEEIKDDPSQQVIAFFQSAGYENESLDDYRKRFRGRSEFISPLPNSYTRITDDQRIQIGDHEWTLRVGEGHSPEHICLYCEDLNLLIAGDQILPRISPNIGVRPIEPHANPLQDWLNSCQKFMRELPEDVLILPSHGDPFYGARIRLQEFIDDHESGLQKLAALCATPQRVVDVFPALFKSEINDGNRVIATSEALAHINYLVAQNKLTVSLDEDGVKWFQQS